MSLLVLMVAACGKDEGSGSTTPPLPVETADTAATDSGTLPADPHTLFACWADVTVDEDDDGTVDQTWFDGMDAAEFTWLMYREGDSNGNGVVDFMEHYTRDALGNVTHFERQMSDEWSYDATYDERGNVLSYARDELADGSTDYAYTATWDANDEILRFERDDDGDGVTDYWYEFTRTPEGYRESAAESEDGDDVVDFTYLYFRDELERESRIEKRDPADVLVTVYTITYTDPALRVGNTVSDEGNDGTTDGYSEFAYDAAGRITHYAVDADPYDGTFEEIEDTVYNVAGQVTSYTAYNANDGDPYTVESDASFDALGRDIETAYTFDFENGLSFAERTRWTYGGTCP